MRKIILIVLVVLAGACPVQAYPDKLFTSSGQIVAGESWYDIDIYDTDTPPPDHTIVDMFGGNVTTSCRLTMPASLTSLVVVYTNCEQATKALPISMHA